MKSYGDVSEMSWKKRVLLFVSVWTLMGLFFASRSILIYSYAEQDCDSATVEAVARVGDKSGGLSTFDRQHVEVAEQIEDERRRQENGGARQRFAAKLGG